jgi:hypothetical protein
MAAQRTIDSMRFMGEILLWLDPVTGFPRGERPR